MSEHAAGAEGFGFQQVPGFPQAVRGGAEMVLLGSGLRPLPQALHGAEDVGFGLLHRIPAGQLGGFGLGQEGLYYFFNVLSKTLAAAGEDRLALADGSTVAWREELVRKLLALQKPEGYWSNENNRWWEADPNLVTAYTLIALATALD